jgi:hypothetical protein
MEFADTTLGISEQYLFFATRLGWLATELTRHLKYTLTFCNACTRTSRSRSFITTLFYSSVHFVPVLVKGLYQTESYSLHVMQLIRI